MEAITTAVGQVMDLAGTMLTEITSNPILTLFFAAGLVPIAIGIVKRLKHV